MKINICIIVTINQTTYFARQPLTRTRKTLQNSENTFCLSLVVYDQNFSPSQIKVWEYSDIDRQQDTIICNFCFLIKSNEQIRIA